LSIIRPDASGAVEFIVTYLWLGALFLIVTLMPNSLQIMAGYEPALDVELRSGNTPPMRAGRLSWRPTIPWAVAVSAVAAVAILQLSGKSEFLYWQF
jgi:hypothetical protein